MKNAPLHSYPWYVADWRGSETRLTLPSAAKYVYRELLDYCWIEGSIPSDELALARIAAVEIKEFRSVWPLIKAKFMEADGRLTHWRVEEKRPKLQSWANSRVKGGGIGGKTKAANLAKDVAIASRNQEVNPLPPLTLPPPSENNPLPPSAVPAFVSKKKTWSSRRNEEWFEEWWAFVWMKVGRGQAEKAFRAKVQTADVFEKVMKATKEQAAVFLEREPQFRPHPATWLNGRRWLDEPVQAINGARYEQQSSLPDFDDLMNDPYHGGPGR